MGTNSICTSVEQSHKLIDMGLAENTADLYYILRRNSEPKLVLFSSAPPEGFLNEIPAWSLSALINLLPKFIESKGKDYCLLMLSDRVVYWDGNITNLYETTQTNLLDAVVDAILWLLRNNYI